MKKILEDIIILQMFTINDSHMIYGFSDMECNRQIFFHFRLHFALSLPSPTNNPKNQNFEKLKKNTWRCIIILHKCIENHNMYYTVT